MPIKKDPSKYSTFLGVIAWLYQDEIQVIDDAIGFTKSKNELLEEIKLLQQEISNLKSQLGIEEAVATTEEVNEGEIVEEPTLDKEEVVEEIKEE